MYVTLIEMSKAEPIARLDSELISDVHEAIVEAKVVLLDPLVLLFTGDTPIECDVLIRESATFEELDFFRKDVLTCWWFGDITNCFGILCREQNSIKLLRHFHGKLHDRWRTQLTLFEQSFKLRRHIRQHFFDWID